MNNKRTYQRIIRVTIVGDMVDRNATLDLLTSEKYDIVKLGPYTDKDVFPKADVSRFLIVAERVEEEWGK